MTSEANTQDEHSKKENPDHYITLRPGDPLREGDEIRWGGEWRKVVIYSPQRYAIRGITYRRRMVW